MFDKTNFSKKLYRLNHPGDTLTCWKSPIYEKSNETAGQESTYHDLNIKVSQYQEIKEKD